MTKLKAMMDGEEGELAFLGALRPIDNEPSLSVALKKKIVVYNLGTYTKKLTTPMYRRQAMIDLSARSSTRSFDASSCMGVLCGSLRFPPIGYVTRVCGGHRFCLPVHELGNISNAFYRIAGYMITDEGFVAVAKRRVLLWVLLGLLCGVTFVLGFLLLQYGAEGAWYELKSLFESLLPGLAL